MDRYKKRKIERLTASFVRKAKLDMETWLQSLATVPTPAEAEAFKAGYIAGANRFNSTD